MPTKSEGDSRPRSAMSPAPGTWYATFHQRLLRMLDPQVHVGFTRFWWTRWFSLLEEERSRRTFPIISESDRPQRPFRKKNCRDKTLEHPSISTNGFSSFGIPLSACELLLSEPIYSKRGVVTHVINVLAAIRMEVSSHNFAIELAL